MGATPEGGPDKRPTNFPLQLILLRYQGRVWNRMELSLVVSGHFATRHVSAYALESTLAIVDTRW